jgi:diaminohydroxyphosphoribosylaminopyrimidine deaminase / 5-amino-6-(5-phosphoribosylamino)uracil reductase
MIFSCSLNITAFEWISKVFCLKGSFMNELYMKQAIELAQRAKGRTSPNPMVGCVIVKDDRIIAKGYHHHCGGVHAEVDALNRVNEDLSDATMYVTLEPCSHHGKQPPCCEAIARSGIKKVVVATLDPNPIVHGRGIAYLKSQHVDIEVGVCEDEAIHMNKIFNHYITHKTPYVLIKAAITLDGKIATKTGESQWISGPQSLKYVHQLRNEYSSIGVGVNTIIVDNPSLTIRLPEQDNQCHHRIIFDSKGRIPLHSKVLNDAFASKTIIVTTSLMPTSIKKTIIQKGARVIEVGSHEGHVDIKESMHILGSLGIDSLFLEGGSEIIASALKAKIVHEVHIALAPKLIGGQDAKGFMGDIGVESLSQAIQLEFTQVEQLGSDIIIKAKVVN